MNAVKPLLVGLSCGLSIISVQQVQAKTVTWCVFDLAGGIGDITRVMKDHALASKAWGVESKLSIFNQEQKALDAFANKQCEGVVATTFGIRQYNNYIGTISAVGLIPNHQVAYQLFQSMGDKNHARYMTENGYEVVGLMPLGPAYFLVKDRSINSITRMTGRSIGVLKEDPSHEKMVRRIGAKPIIVKVDTGADFFKRNQIDILPAPGYAFRPLELQKGLGPKGGIVNFPISYFALSVLVRQDAVPTHYGQKSREWFSAKNPQMMHMIIRWEKSIANKYWYDIPISDRLAYQRLVAQLRKDFIKNKIYDANMVNRVLALHCAQDSTYFECKK